MESLGPHVVIKRLGIVSIPRTDRLTTISHYLFGKCSVQTLIRRSANRVGGVVAGFVLS
jgi:hypothetical protein